MAEGFWALHHDADRLDAAADSWLNVATVLATAADDLTRDARRVLATGWEGRAERSYTDHRRRFVRDLDRGAQLARRVTRTLRDSADTVRRAQDRLAGQWARVSVVPWSLDPAGKVLFAPRTEAETRLLRRAIVTAQRTRASLDESLATDTTRLQSTTRRWRALTTRWSEQAAGLDQPFFTWKREQDSVGVISTGGLTVVNAGPGADSISVSHDPATGQAIVTVNGTRYRVPAGQSVVVHGGGGDDTISVPPGTPLELVVLGGEGADRIQGGDGADALYGGLGEDVISAGAGADRVSGGADRDYVDGQGGDDVLSGGTGDDVVYGLDGADSLDGGAGADYLEGGTGNDTLRGATGNDILSGGDGDDVLRGGQGADVAYAGRGNDVVAGGLDTDKAFVEAGDLTDAETPVRIEIPATTDRIQIVGSPDFVTRVQADLDMLAGSPRGAAMLAALGTHLEGGDTLTISETTDERSFALYRPYDGAIRAEIHDNPTSIGYNGLALGDSTPVETIMHEAAHVLDFMTGNDDYTPYTGVDVVDHGVRQLERHAVGLPVDHDHDPSTPEIIDPEHPAELSGNGMRDEMGLPLRAHYNRPT